MGARIVDLHPEAIADGREAREWYQARSAQAAELFRRELEDAIRRRERACRSHCPLETKSRLLENAHQVEIRALRRQVAEAAIEQGGYPLA